MTASYHSELDARVGRCGIVLSATAWEIPLGLRPALKGHLMLHLSVGKPFSRANPLPKTTPRWMLASTGSRLGS